MRLPIGILGVITSPAQKSPTDTCAENDKGTIVRYNTISQGGKPMSAKHNNQRLLEAIKNGDVNEVQRLIPISDPNHENIFALRYAVERGNIECVKALIPVSEKYDTALTAAARNNKVEYVKLLLPLSGDHEEALNAAAKDNHIECVKLLLPGCCEVGAALCVAIQNHHNQCAQLLLTDCLQKNTSHMEEWALHTAVWYENTEAVKMLLPFVDPSIKGSQALAVAVYTENQECFDLLYPRSNPDSALEFVEQNFGYKVGFFQSFQDTIERAKAKQQRSMLNEEVGDNNNPVKHKQKI